ncbi:peptide ABC transporter substrate-binding protein [Candidatus Chloroploca sp. M-50]|uniref:Peptide ABC transporter substrate-binding protein n=1 Tax=Candidatus Chloroploca mongolica TaxID=2528176 RepID=A0ABS4D8C6_9CHLR|nr:peptide ABC transporter substrate-binding protein [Candidatus Chloroploca mongolica]MBP1465682.1 peptide ABC transporter substrate-binding protein [Candidatus Chloroploca mongolica]
MNKLNWRSSLAVGMLLALLLPILAACGGGTATVPTTPPAPEAATTAPAPDTPTTPPAPDTPTTPPAPSTGTAQAGVLRINTGNEPDNVDPQKSSFVSEIQFIMMAYQALMTFDGNMEPIPAAAESVETSADGLKYTFKLRPDGQYSDGTPVTAQNFEYAWRRLADPETAGEYQSLPCGIIKGYSEYSATACEGMEMEEALARDQDELLANFGVKAIDDLTLEIELVAPAPYFLSMAALWIGAPAREQDIAKGDDWWYYPENYIGNGPFIMTEWDHGNRAVWEANPNYAGPLGPVALQRVEYYMITESQVAFQAYQNGELDMLAVAPEDLQAVQSDPTLSQELLPVSGSCTFYFGFNTTKAPFEDLKVRQGFAQAFDREAWNRDIFGGLGSVAYSFIPPGFPGYQPELRLWEFDPEAAKALIAESSYGGVENLPEIKLTYSASARNNARFEWMAGQLKTNLGIDAVLDPIDPTAFSAATKDNPPQMFSLGWCADYPDPQNWISLFQTNGLLSTRVGYSNPEFDALVIQADVEQDPVKRAELYAQAQEILVTDAPVAFTRNDGGYELVKPYVQGVTGETITPIDYWYGFFNMPNVDVQP